MTKAKQRLKEFASFSPNLESFVQLFYDHLDSDRQEEAIDILLETVYEMLTSPGEQFDELLARVDAQKRESLLTWLEQSRSQL